MPRSAVNTLLLLARLLAGGALLVAGAIKLTGGPLAFALSIRSFDLVPDALALASAYFLPWFEIGLGAALVAGIWNRQAGLLAAGVYAIFTAALASVILRGMDVDCGCFGDLFGGSTVSWMTIARNGLFVAASLAVLALGGGDWAVEREPNGEDSPARVPEHGVGPTAEVPGQPR